MDFKILFQTIMTDTKGSKNNIAAKFQNALNLNFSPPIGVFWDIENVQVPKGKSAIALVQNIREKFFKSHREAEFMCVCDISKENKTVIQELILAQVTVVHISATSKNAADDKLKQCMRRFVDTHGAPATLLLISDDVNFSSDLSDFRHRHNIRIILLHRGRAHASLIACAHEHYEFASIAFDLPARSPVKPISKHPNMLVVTDLPLNRNAGQIKTLLRKLSVNCGGKVSEIKGNLAYIKFATADAAERAQKRMDKENVFGNEISVNFCHPVDCDFSPSKRNKNYHFSNETSGSGSSSRDSSLSPTREIEENKFGKKFDFPPPPIFDSQTCPSLLKNKSVKEFQPTFSRLPLQGTTAMEAVKDGKNFHMDWNRKFPASNLTNSKSASDLSAFSPFKKETDSRIKYSHKNVGRVSPFVMQDSDKNSRSIFSDSTNLKCGNSQGVSAPNSFLLSNHAYQNAAQNVASSFDFQHISDPYFYSSSWNRVTATSEPGLSIGRNNPVSALDNPSSVELFVSNLDPTFDVNEMKKILLSVFREHVMVLHISMSLQPDGGAKATVKVPSLQDAQLAISRLHRKKIGHKRILISHVASDKTLPFHILRSETIALLNDIPNRNLPLIKFRELYEKRYHRPIAVSELYKMRETVTIQGDSGSRIVYLNSEYCSTPSLPDSEDSQECNTVEKPYCEVHYHVSPTQGWAERYSICPLPLVNISLKTLATGVHRLLDSHQGSLPLISFCDCYEAEIGPMPIVGHFISCTDDSSEMSLTSTQTFADKGLKGVPLEHLIHCISGVEVASSPLNIKKVQWLENKADSQISQNLNPALLGQLTLFGREVIDLLKNQPQCLVPFKKFIPTYHHHFGRQCRVADYGFTKLIHLLEAIPHIAQVLGEGQNRQVTLTHRTQVKRFAAELLRILKSRASKQILVSEFAEAYEQVVEKPFEVTNYGICEIEDMLDEVPESVVVTSFSGDETVIAIPKREQTPEEIERTEQFAGEVIELMKHTTNCSMAFNKFIPSYHHHFGKQCRMADYGFTKLIELFEAIPSVLEVKGTGEEKVLKLVESEQHKILVDRLLAVLQAQPSKMVEINQLCSGYSIIFGHVLRPFDFGFTDLNEMLKKLDYNFMVITRARRQFVCLVNPDVVRQVSLNTRRLLMEEKEGRMQITELCLLYEERYGPNIDLVHYFKKISDIQVTDEFLQLTPIQLFARDLILLLQDNGFQMLLSNLTSLFHQRYGVPIYFTEQDFSSFWNKLHQLTDYFIVKGRKQKRVVHLHPDIIGNPLPDYRSLSSVRNPKNIFNVVEPLFQPYVKKNTAAVPNIVRISNPASNPTSVGNQILQSLQQCSTSKYALSCFAPPFKMSTNSALQGNQPYITHQPATEIFQTDKLPINSVIEISEKNIADWTSKPKTDAKNMFVSPNSSKGLVSNQSASSIETPTNHNHLERSKDDDSSAKSTPNSESKQSRRKRIAAQFSSPIND